MYNIYIYNFSYYYIIILSNYFPKIQLSVMPMVVTIMLFGRPISLTFTVSRFYIEILDASSEIKIKYLYTSEILRVSSSNCCPWF